MTTTAKLRRIPRYMSRAEVAARLGLKSIRSLSGTQLPPPDAEIGNHPGWWPETIEKWIEARPGRGWWGARQD